MTDKQINKWLRRRFSWVALVLLAYYGLITLLTTLTALTDCAKQYLVAFAAGDFRGYLDMDVIASNAWGYIAATLLMLVLLDAWKGSSYWKQELLVKNRPMKPGVLPVMLCFCMGAQLANGIWISFLEILMNGFGRSVMPVLESVSGDSSSVSMFLYSALFAPVGEEILFRGFVLGSLRPYGKRFAVMGSAILFGLFHGNLLQTPYAIFMGLILGYITVEYTLGWAVVLHVFNNLVLAEFLTRLTAGWPEMACGILNLVLFGGSALISLVVLMVKRREIRDYRQSEWMDRKCIRCFFTSGGMILFMLIMCVNIALVMLAY